MRLAVALAVVLVAALLLGRQVLSPTPTPPPPATGVGLSGPWWPLDVGTLWRYQVTDGVAEFRTRAYQVAEPRLGGLLVFESTDGAQTDDFVVHRGEGDEIRFKEYQRAAKDVTYLPPVLEPGETWLLKKNSRAYVRKMEPITVPAFPEPISAMRVDYETNYLPSETQAPGWYPEASRWFARGIGLLREDLRSRQGPPELEELIARSRYQLDLTEYKPAEPPAEPPKR